jgi:hypothetical protein
MQNPKPQLYNMPGMVSSGPGVKKSLNREKRRRELVKITQEN